MTDLPPEAWQIIVFHAIACGVMLWPAIYAQG